MRRSDAIVRFVSAVILSLFAVAALRFLLLYRQAYDSFSSAPSNAGSDIIQVFLYGVSEDSASARFDLLNNDGSSIAQVERSWKDTRLRVDFICYNSQGRNYVFPYRICGEQSASETTGVRLSSYYSGRNASLLLGESFSDAQRSALSAVQSYCLSGTSRMLDGSISLKSVSLSSCEAGRYYMIKSDQNGNLILYSLN